MKAPPTHARAPTPTPARLVIQIYTRRTEATTATPNPGFDRADRNAPMAGGAGGLTHPSWSYALMAMPLV